VIRRILPIMLLAGVTASPVLLTGCSGRGENHGMSMMPMNVAPRAGVIDVHLYNWVVAPTVSTAAAGPVTFRAIHDMAHSHMANEGGVIHDLTVARKLPGGDYEVLGRVTDILMGQVKELTVDFTPGDYELQCNTVEDLGGGRTIGHYAQGMHVDFTVS